MHMRAFLDDLSHPRGALETCRSCIVSLGHQGDFAWRNHLQARRESQLSNQVVDEHSHDAAMVLMRLWCGVPNVFWHVGFPRGGLLGVRVVMPKWPTNLAIRECPKILGTGSCGDRYRTGLQHMWEVQMGRGILLWLLGVPIPVIILLALLWR
jgi:hypothetical protein